MPTGRRWGECVFKSAPPSLWAEAKAAASREGREGPSRPGRRGIRTRGGAPGVILGSVAAGWWGLLSLDSAGAASAPGWAELAGARAGRARSLSWRWQSPAAEPDAPEELRLPGKHARAGPRADRVPWSGTEASRPSRPTPLLSPKSGATPGSCAGRSGAQLLYPSLPRSGDNVAWRHPLLASSSGSPPGQLGFRRS